MCSTLWQMRSAQPLCGVQNCTWTPTIRLLWNIHWQLCELCYMDSENLPISEGSLPTMEHDGYGERLGSDDEENDIPQW